MICRILSVLYIISIVQFGIFAQLKPETFSLSSEGKYFSKITSSNPASNSIIDILTIGDTIWLGTSRGVSVSYDNGDNWTNFYGNPAFGSDNVSALAYNQYNGSIWAATATSVSAPGGGTIPKGTGLKYTTDKGITWTSIPQPVDNPDSSKVVFGINTLNVLPITVTEQNLTYDIAFTPNAVWITSFAGGTRRSTDMGETWQRIILPTDSLNSISPSDTLSERDKCISPTPGNFCSLGWLNYRAFSVVAANDSTIYVGTANGINKTTNANERFPSWIKFNHQNQEQPISGNFITALAYNKYDNILWASTWKAEDQNEFYGISSSTNGGQTWKTFLTDERTHNFGFKNIHVMVATDNGVFRSSDKGLTWILPNSIVDQESGASLKTKIFYDADSYANNIWLASNDGLVKIVEPSEQMWQGNWKIYFASSSLSSDEETYCYPNPFNPRHEELNIKYSTGGQLKNITIQIFDFGFNYIRTIIQNVPKVTTVDTEPVDSWDGRDENGNYVPNGVYFYRVKKGDEAVYGKILVIQ